MLDPKIEKRARAWMGREFDPQVRAEIQQLFDRKAWEELTDRFYMDLEFGTGGMRGLLEAGTNRMNEYVIRMTSQGLANYVLKQTAGRGASAVIAHDPRHKSDLFALETALVLAGNGITAYLFRELRPTPVLSFAVRHLGATTGVVITASHNPPEYNGYKVYWSDGGQIVPPHDSGIIREVRKITSLEDVRRLPREEAEKKGLLRWLEPEVDEAYLAAVAGQIVQPEVVRQAAETLSVVYTPLHGTGVTMVPRALERMGLTRVEVLESQRHPDPDFSTVKSPNPEEKAALGLAIERAGQTGAQLVIGTDPDCDRMGCAYRDSRGGYTLLNGNQIGSILCHYMLDQLSRRSRLPSRPVIIKTIVTTELQRAIAESYGAEIVEVLTGFKYIGEKIRSFEEPGDGRQFIFGGEESYGYLAGTYARDKDAVVSSQLLSEVAAWCAGRGLTLGDYLDEIYRKYGFYLESGRSLTLKGREGAQQITALMERFRAHAPQSLAGSLVSGVWDLESGERRNFQTGKKEKTDLPAAKVLMFFLEDGGRVTMRPSGTEPKIKFYFGVVGKVPEGGSLEELKAAAGERLAALDKEFLSLVEASLSQGGEG